MKHEFDANVTPVTDHGATVVVRGDFDAACVARFDERVGVLAGTQHAVSVDLCGCTIIDSAALGALIRLADSCRSTKFETVVAKPFQIELLRITGLDDFLSMRVRDD
ncbi:MAG: STAS domain-containing protein [Ilumatobacteraceae bacterium]